MDRTRLIVAAMLGIVGLVWIAQGLGLLRSSSFMVDDVRWAAIGVGCLAAGLAISLRSRGRGPRVG